LDAIAALTSLLVLSNNLFRKIDFFAFSFSFLWSKVF